VLGIGEVFSLNAETGPRNRATGYKESLIFSNGKVVPGIGGGVCQVSSTTYQAALRADLRIVERQSHSMQVSYIAPGLDATTFYPIVDLKFQNTRSGPILLWTEIRGNALTVSVYGSGARPDIQIRTATKKTIPPSTRIVYDTTMRPNARVVESAGSPGSVVASWRLTYDNGQVVKREPLAIVEYRPRARVIRVGN
jgi:vancomycin resistance protein YoaR